MTAGKSRVTCGRTDWYNSALANAGKFVVVNHNPLKQRLVGAIVLVALAVIFIPLFLSGERDDGEPLFGSKLPSKPDELTNMQRQELEHTVPPPAAPSEIRTLVDRDSPPAAVTDTPTTPLSTPSDTPAATKKDKPVAPAPDPATADKPAPSGPHGWVVQIGSFSDKTNALKLRDKVRGQGFQAFVEAVTRSDGRVFRVRVGPEAERSKAEALQTQLASKAKVKGIVVTHP